MTFSLPLILEIDRQHGENMQEFLKPHFGHLFEDPISGPGVLMGSIDGFHEATEIEFVVLGVCVFLGRVSKAFIKFMRKSSEWSIFMEVDKKLKLCH